MKKMILLMMLVFTVPATAGVVISCDGGIISYDATGIAGNVRAFALDITSDGTITGVQCLSTDYDIYPGSIQIDEGTGQVTDPGTCVCDSSYPGTLDGIGTAGVTVEMGSLYASGEPAPADTGDLVQVTHTGTTLTVNVNVIRGGIVMENPDQDPDHNLPIVCGGPACSCLGDLSGDGTTVNIQDFYMLLGKLNQANDNYGSREIPKGNDPMGLWDDCADISGDGSMINIQDFYMLLGALNQAYDTTGERVTGCL